MALRIYTNIQALISHDHLRKTDHELGRSIERLSSGLRINKAADDAAGSAIVASTTSQVSGLNLASQNAQDGVNLGSVADGALAQAQDILARARDLAVQMANGTYSASDRQFAQDEVTQLFSSLDQLSQYTNFNGVNLLSTSGGGGNAITFQTGAYAGQDVAFNLQTVNSSTLTLGAVNISTQTGASNAISQLDAAINQVSSVRSQYGASQTLLQQTVNATSTTSNNLEAALSRIRDLDFAAETTNLAKHQILQQSGISVHASANLTPQSVLRLLQ